MIEKIRSLTAGHRKLIVFFGASAFLFAGLVTCIWLEAAASLFPTYATAITAAAGVFTYGNVKEQPKP